MSKILLLALVSGCLKPQPQDSNAGDPEISVTPDALEFGEVLQHSTSTASITIANLGDGPLSGTLAVQGAADFVLDAGIFSLEPGTSTVVGMSFQPDDFGRFSDSLNILSNDPARSIVVIPLSAEVLQDEDGDGYTPEDDCDDSDPDRNPGADEIWYDGVDQDCAGDDDDDQDGDGVAVDDDCDDTDADAYPGNTETWYDGVDGDCDNRNDYDQDQDGYLHSSGGGEDCDDTDADVNPGTLEDPNDGIDNDCDDEVDESLSSDDLDGDGYSEAGGDCNDDDAEIYPGATEDWYDGVDQDCAGDSDFDQDGDGEDWDTFGGLDCDDTDASVYPGATETWYDGVDSDCDGRSDDDADRDGYDSDAQGGDDCDDTDAGVNPGAAELWYDGYDQDCDGANDFDQDGDGHESDAYSGDDCDDTTAAAYPGNAETWYDGLDGDCLGGDDYDQDGDGEPSDAYSGADCDDTDASVNPSADEYCDGVDNDCSGTVDDDYALDATTWYIDADGDTYGDPNLPTVACNQPTGAVADNTDCDDGLAISNPGAPEVGYDLNDNDCDGLPDEMLATDWLIYDISGIATSDGIASALAIGDMNADGDIDLFVGAPGDDTTATAAGAVGAFDASTLSTRADMSDGFSIIRGLTATENFGTSVVLLGDADEDGNIELAIGAPYDDESASNGGMVRIIDLAGTHASGNALVSAKAYVMGTEANGFFGTTMDAGDYDGDGLADIVVGAPGENGVRGRAWIQLADDGYLESADVATDTTNIYFKGDQTNEALGSAVMLHADLSGDGTDDLVACANQITSYAGRCWLVAGSAGQSHPNHKIKDYDRAQFSGSAASDGMGSTPGSLAAGDLDGDGQADLIIGVPGYDGGTSNGGAVLVWYGGSSLTGTYTFAQADHVLTGDGGLGSGLNAGRDVDGDGFEDLLAGAPTGNSGTGALYLVRGPLLAPSYSLPADQSASWLGTTSGDAFGTLIMGFGDLNGDGTDDFAVTAPGSDRARTDAGTVYVLPVY